MAIKYSTRDKELFIQILGGYKIVEDKRTDVHNNEKKKIAWEKIALEYNNLVTEKRTVVQLKRLWDKIKRLRKRELAEEREKVMATGGGPPIALAWVNGGTYMENEVDIGDDSDGIRLNRNVKVEHDESRSTPSITPGSAEEVCTSLSLELEENQVVEHTTKRKKMTPPPNKHHLDIITEARLLLIKKEEEQLNELHKIRVEEANYRKEAARLVMLQEEAKLKKILNV